MPTPTIEQREDGLRWIVVREGWSEDLTELVNSGRVDGIELNSAKGSWERGLPFIGQVPSLRHLILIDFEERDVSAATIPCAGKNSVHLLSSLS